jgi:hypothetical protein
MPGIPTYRGDPNDPRQRRGLLAFGVVMCIGGLILIALNLARCAGIIP